MGPEEIYSQAMRYALQLAGNRPASATDVLSVAERFANFIQRGEVAAGESHEVVQSREEYGARYPDGTVKWDSDMFCDLSREHERDSFLAEYRDQLKNLGADPSLADSVVFVRRFVKVVVSSPEVTA